MSRLTVTVIILAGIISLFGACSPQTSAPRLVLETGLGPAAWDSTGSSGVYGRIYLDGGDSAACLVIDSDSSGRLELVSSVLEVTAGRPVSFAFALQTFEAAGRLLEVRITWLDDSLRTVADTLIFELTGEAGDLVPGDTRGWIEYTRALRVPAGTSALKLSLISAPTAGKVRLGACRFDYDEGWLAYAATFSTHLGRNPEDKYRFTAGRNISPEITPEPTRQESAAGLLMFERKGWVNATPYAVPRAQDRSGTLYERVPRGVVAPLAFAIKALENLTGVTAAITIEPSGENGSLRARPVLYQGRFAAARLEGSWSTVFGPRARLLERPSPANIPAGENLFYWLDVPVPETTPPGIYEGRISVQAEGRQPLDIACRIEVLDVILDPLPDSVVAGIYYYPPDNPQELEAQFRDMAEHGINGLSLAGSFVTLSEAGSLRIDWDEVVKLDRLMGLMRRYGMRRPTPLYVADIFRKLNIPQAADRWTDEHEKLFIAAVRLMNSTAVSRGWNPLMFFTVDEPANNPEHMELARHTLSLLHEIPEITTLCDLNTPGSIEELAQYLDAVVIQISSVSPHTVELTAGKGLQTFFYLPAFGSSDVGHDAAYHRAIPGWFLPRSGTRGVYYFAYRSTEGDPHDELDGGHRDWCASYPAPGDEPPRPSPEWQGIRRGIEDLRLVHTASALASRCLAVDDEAVRQRGREAADRLKGIMEQLEQSGPAVIYQLHHRLDTYVAESWRRELLDEVIRMQQALEGK